MDQDIASAINRALFHAQALAQIRIMNPGRNAMGAITVITHQNSRAEIALRYHTFISTEARTVSNGALDVEENESWEGLKINEVCLVQYMGRGTEGLWKMREALEAKIQGVKIPTQV